MFCVSGDMGADLFLPLSPVRPPLLPCLFSVKSLRRRAAVTVWAQETGQEGQGRVSSCDEEEEEEGGEAGREEAVRTPGQ